MIKGDPNRPPTTKRAACRRSISCAMTRKPISSARRYERRPRSTIAGGKYRERSKEMSVISNSCRCGGIGQIAMSAACGHSPVLPLPRIGPGPLASVCPTCCRPARGSAVHSAIEPSYIVVFLLPSLRTGRTMLRMPNAPCLGRRDVFLFRSQTGGLGQGLHSFGSAKRPWS